MNKIYKLVIEYNLKDCEFKLFQYRYLIVKENSEFLILSNEYGAIELNLFKNEICKIRKNKGKMYIYTYIENDHKSISKLLYAVGLKFNCYED